MLVSRHNIEQIIQDGLKRVGKELLQSNWIEAEDELNDLYFNHPDYLKESPSLIKAFILNAYAISQIVPPIEKTAHVGLDKYAKREPTYTFDFDFSIDGVEKDSIGKNDRRAWFYLSRALKLSTEKMSMSGLLGVAGSYLNVFKCNLFREPRDHVENLRSILTSFEQVGEKQFIDPNLGLLFYLISTQVIILAENQEGKLATNVIEEVKSLLLKAGNIAHENPSLRRTYSSILCSMEHLIPGFMETIEPKWQKNPLLKIYVTLRHFQVNQTAITLQFLNEAESVLNKDVHVQGEKPSGFYVNQLVLRIDLAKEALAMGEHLIAEKLLSGWDKADIDQTSKLYIKLLQVEITRQKVPTNASEAELNGCVVVTAQSIGRIICEASEALCHEVVIDGCIRLWNTILSVLEDHFRPSLISLLRDASSILEHTPIQVPDLHFLFHLELAKCYESGSLLSLAKAHADKAVQSASQLEYYEEGVLTLNRIEAKMKSLSRDLPDHTKALMLVDRSATLPPIAALDTLEESMRVLVPSYERQRLPVFRKGYNGQYTSLLTPSARQVKYVFLELMNSAYEQARKASLAKGAVREDILVGVWGITYQAGLIYLEITSEQSSLSHQEKKMIANGHRFLGEAQGYTLSTNVSPQDAQKIFEISAKHLLQSVFLAKDLNDLEGIYSAIAQIWKLYVITKNTRGGFTLSGDLELETLQKVYEIQVELEMTHTTLFVYVCTGYASLLTEAFQYSTDPAKAKNRSTPPKDPSQYLKIADDVCRTGFACKETDFGAMSLLVQTWGKIQQLKAGPIATVDVEDPLVKLFCSMELSQATKLSKEQEFSNLENALRVLSQLKSIPPIFKTETLIRVSIQAAHIGEYTTAYGCLMTALSCIAPLAKEKKDKNSRLEQWLASTYFAAARICFVILDQDACPLHYNDMALVILGHIADCFSRCFEYPEETYDTFTSCFQLFWNLSSSFLTKNRAHLIQSQFVSVVKSVCAQYLQNQAFSRTIQRWDAETYKGFRNMLLAVIDIEMDSKSYQLAIKTAELALKVLPVNLQKQAWHRKTLLLNILGKGSNPVPLKDPNLIAHAEMWNQLARSLSNPSKKTEAFQMASKVLLGKKGASSDSLLVRTAQIEYAEWVAAHDDVSSHDHLKHLLMQSPTEDSSGPRNTQDLFETVRYNLLCCLCTKNEKERDSILFQSWAHIETSLHKLIKGSKPKEETVEPSPNVKAPAGNNKNKKQAAKEAVPVESLEVPTLDRWVSYEWPTLVRQTFSISSSHDFPTKASITEPFEGLSILLRLVYQLLLRNLLQECLLLMSFMELIAQECCRDNSDVEIAILLFHAIILQKMGQQKRSKEVYSLAMSKDSAQRGSLQLNLVSHKARKDPSLCPLGDLQRIWLFKAECHLYFGDLLESRDVLVQLIRLCQSKDDYHVLQKAYCLQSRVDMELEEFETSLLTSDLCLMRLEPNEDWQTSLNAAFVSCISHIHSVTQYTTQSLDIFDNRCSYLVELISNSTISPSKRQTLEKSLLNSQMSIYYNLESKFGINCHSKRHRVLNHLRQLCRDNAQEETQIISTFLDKLEERACYSSEFYKELESLVEHLYCQHFSSPPTAVLPGLLITRVLLLKAKFETLSAICPKTVPRIIKRGNVIEEYLADLDRQLYAPKEDTKSTVELALQKLRKFTLSQEDIHFKPVLDFCMGMDVYVRSQSAEQPMQESQSKDPNAAACKLLNAALEYQLTNGDFVFAKATAEALFALCKPHDTMSAFKHLCIMQGCESSVYLKTISTLVSGQKKNKIVKIPFCGYFIEQIPSVNMDNDSTDETSSFANLFDLNSLDLSQVEWPKSFKVLVLQHSHCGKKLFGAMLSRKREAKLETKKRDKGTTSDDYITEYEFLSVEADVDKAKDIVKQSIEENYADALDLMDQYLNPLLSQFKRDADPTLNVISEKETKESSKPKTAAVKEDPPPPEEVHCVVCSDSILESFAFETILLKRLKKVHTVSRDFNVVTLISRIKSTAKPGIVEASKKNQKQNESLEKEKSAVNGFSYCISSSATDFVDTARREVELKSLTRVEMTIGTTLGFEEIIEASRKMPLFIYTGQPFNTPDALKAQLVGGLSGKAAVILDYSPTRKSSRYTTNIKAVAAYFTLCGVTTIARPLWGISDKEVLLAVKAITSLPAGSSLVKACSSLDRNGLGGFLQVYGLDQTINFS